MKNIYNNNSVSSTMNNLLNKKSVRLPIEPNLYEKPEIRNNMKVISDLKGKLEGVDKGLGGLFSIYLQDLIGGEILELNYLSIRNGIPFTTGHLFVYKDGYCYDCDGVCSMSTLQLKKKIKRVYSDTTLKYLPTKEHYFLKECSEEEILKSYLEGSFGFGFSLKDIEKLDKNSDKSHFKIKVRNVIGNVFKSF
jgi:hypothetical protein